MDWRIDRRRFTLLFGCMATSCCVFSSATVAIAPSQISMANFRRIIAEFVANHEVPRNEIISPRDVLP
jgi:hypothetical protein